MNRIAGFYKEILDKLDSYCLVCDSKKRVIFANRALVEDRGGLRDDTTCHELLFYITDECPWCQQQRVLEGRAVQRDIFSPSDTAHYSLVVIPVPLENGSTGCLHILNRISEGDLERKKAERYARFLEQIIENAPIMIFGNKNGKICLFNEECQRVTGYSREEVLGKDLFELFVTEDDMPRVRQHCKLVLSGGFEPGFEFSWRTKSGQLRRIMWNCMLLEDPNGEPIVFGMGVDVTEQRRLEQQFLQAQKMETVGRMAGGLAHDINNFLTAVRTSAELALMDTSDPQNVQANLERILKAVERTSSLTRQLLTFSRKEIIRPEFLDVNEVIEGLFDMLSKLLGEDIRLETILRRDVGTIFADRNQLEQILVNLAVNARDAMPTGGVLQIETDMTRVEGGDFPEKIGLESGEYVIISVSDTGEGIDPKIISYVFDPFFTTKPRGQGTGLGLSTVYSIVKQNGGHISIYSEQGKGTTFKIYWPVSHEKDGQYSEASDLERGKLQDLASKGETILVTEDDPIVLETVSSLLESLGYKVFRAKDAQEAIEIAKLYAGTIQLLFTDVVLPEMNGKELYERIKEEIPGIKVLFTSGYTENIIARHGVLEHGVSFIQKPYELSTLAKVIREVLDGVVIS